MELAALLPSCRLATAVHASRWAQSRARVAGEAGVERTSAAVSAKKHRENGSTWPSSPRPVGDTPGRDARSPPGLPQANRRQPAGDSTTGGGAVEWSWRALRFVARGHGDSPSRCSKTVPGLIATLACSGLRRHFAKKTPAIRHRAYHSRRTADNFGPTRGRAAELRSGTGRGAPDGSGGNSRLEVAKAAPGALSALMCTGTKPPPRKTKTAQEQTAYGSVSRYTGYSGLVDERNPRSSVISMHRWSPTADPPGTQMLTEIAQKTDHWPEAKLAL